MAKEEFRGVYKYAEKAATWLDEKIIYGSYTENMETDNDSIDWSGARKFKTEDILVSGNQYHTRPKGYNYGTIGQTEQEYELGFDRDIEYYWDKADQDETANLIQLSNILREHTDEHTIPELDAYRFSKLAYIAQEFDEDDMGGKGIYYKKETLTKDNAFSSILESLNTVRRFGTLNTVGFIDSDVTIALELSTETGANVKTFQNDAPYSIDTRIAQINSVRFTEVLDKRRFYSAYDFADDFKFEDQDGNLLGAEINYIIAYKPGIIAKRKIDDVFYFAPGDHTEGNGHLLQMRLYHDLFVKRRLREGLIVSVKG